MGFGIFPNLNWSPTFQLFVKEDLQCSALYTYCTVLMNYVVNLKPLFYTPIAIGYDAIMIKKWKKK